MLVLGLKGLTCIWFIMLPASVVVALSNSIENRSKETSGICKKQMEL